MMELTGAQQQQNKIRQSNKLWWRKWALLLGRVLSMGNTYNVTSTRKVSRKLSQREDSNSSSSVQQAAEQLTCWLPYACEMIVFFYCLLASLVGPAAAEIVLRTRTPRTSRTSSRYSLWIYATGDIVLLTIWYSMSCGSGSKRSDAIWAEWNYYTFFQQMKGSAKTNKKKIGRPWRKT